MPTETSQIKAIETIYNGYRFRSRLEARWAVFFDAMGIAYEYEKEGYDLGEAGWYLPDFYIPKQDVMVNSPCWIEIKGQDLNKDDWDKVTFLSDSLQTYVFIGQIPQNPAESENYTESAWGGDHPNSWDCQQWWCKCPSCGRFGIVYCGIVRRLGCACNNTECNLSTYDDPEILRAYKAARQARFEHGETPQPKTDAQD